MPINPIGPKEIPKAENFRKVLSQREKAYLDKSFKPDGQQKRTRPKESIGRYIDLKV